MRRMCNQNLTLACGLLLAALSSGCRTPPRYAALTEWPHKDVAVLSIYVEHKLEVDEYLGIVDREVKKLVSDLDPAEIPVYEVRFEFFLPSASSSKRRQIAQVSLVSENGSHTGLSGSPEVILY